MESKKAAIWRTVLILEDRRLKIFCEHGNLPIRSFPNGVKNYLKIQDLLVSIVLSPFFCMKSLAAFIECFGKQPWKKGPQISCVSWIPMRHFRCSVRSRFMIRNWSQPSNASNFSNLPKQQKKATVLLLRRCWPLLLLHSHGLNVPNFPFQETEMNRMTTTSTVL